jgi:hypothetical protein
VENISAISVVILTKDGARLYVEKNFKWENFGENIFKFLKVVLRV